MLPIQTILHPSDFSDRSNYALQMATALARDYQARLIIMHVIPQPIIAYGEGVIPPDPELLRREAQEQFNKLPLLDVGVHVETRLADGDEAAGILHLARELTVDLIVMGTHGRTGIRRLLMGSVAEQVMRRSACPVLTVTAPFPVLPSKTDREALAVAGRM